MAAIAEQIGRLRRQRNFAAVGAVLLVVLATAVVLPDFRERQRQVTGAADELVGLQARLVAEQQQLRNVQAELGRTQDDIRNLLHRAH